MSDTTRDQSETVTIPNRRYQELLDAEAKLTRLENAGVDNWEGYSYAFEGYAP